MDTARKIVTPIATDVLASLKMGERVFLSGRVYVARDAAHARMLLVPDEGLPFNPAGELVYYAGPAPAKEGQIIGPMGPTTSGRMDVYTPPLLELGLAGTIGKGRRSDDVKRSMIKNGAVYFGATGGAAVLLSRCVRSVRTLAYPEMGPEALLEIEVLDMPLVVAIDVHGNDIYAR